MLKYQKCLKFFLGSTSLLACLSFTAIAEESAQDDAKKSNKIVLEIEEVIVTGTYLQSRSQFASASPLQIVSSEKLSNIGAANFADLVQTLTINNGAQNNPDSFTQSGTVGTSNFNLRGLGVSSTLVLLNGRRQVLTSAVTNDGVNFVDINSIIPQIATKRVEIVKDGAAALYGTDAVAGVVNFITDNDFEGIEARIRYGAVTDEGSQGDFLAEAKAGIAGDNWNLMGALSYYDRTELTTAERRLSRTIDDTSALGNPGSFFLFGQIPVIDPNGCADLGGIPQPIPAAQAALDSFGLPFEGGLCGFDFGDFFTLVPEEQRLQGFVSASTEFSGGHVLRGEFTFANNDSSRSNSPSFPALQLNSTVVPDFHPNNPFPAALAPVVFFGRPIGVGGVSSPVEVSSDTFRYSAELSGPINNYWDYSLAFTRGQNEFLQLSSDTVSERFQNALNGLGGANCDPATGTAGQGGCLFFNPFSSALTGEAPNDPALLDFLIIDQFFLNRSELTVIDAVVSGAIADLPAGEIGVAAGFQYRDELYSRSFDDLTNQDAFAFFVGDQDFSANRDVFAFFIETVVPLADGLEFQAAARFEDYGGTIGSSVDPKIALLWAATNNLTFRGSFSTSFRAPSIFQQFGGATIQNQVFDPISGSTFFSSVRNFQPGEEGRSITPEESNALNLGFTYESDQGLRFSVDYWRYSFSEVIVQENFQTVINAAPNGDRVVRADPNNPASPILFVFTDFVNASQVLTQGVDINIAWDYETDLGTFSPFLEGTWILAYDINDPQLGDVDGLGNRNFTNFGNPTPPIRFNAGFSFENSLNSLRAYFRFIDNYNDDQLRTGDTTPGVRNIAEHITVDLQYSLNLNWLTDSFENTALNVGVINAFDNAPPLVRTNGGFDSRTHDPRGRFAYVELSIKF